MDCGATERIDGQFEAGGANGLHIDNVTQIGDVGQDEVFLLRRISAESGGEAHPFHASLPLRNRSLARFSIHLVTSLSAGPPCVGLYLNPPSSGGLCEGVMTMPSARCPLLPRLCTRIAREMTGVGVN